MGEKYTNRIFGFEDDFEAMARMGCPIFIDTNIIRFGIGGTDILDTNLSNLIHPEFSGDVKEHITLNLRYASIMAGFVQKYENIAASNLVLGELDDYLKYFRGKLKEIRHGNVGDYMLSRDYLYAGREKGRHWGATRIIKNHADIAKKILNAYSKNSIMEMKSICTTLRAIYNVLEKREDKFILSMISDYFSVDNEEPTFRDIKKVLFRYEHLLGHEDGKATDTDIDLVARGFYMAGHGHNTILFTRDNGIKRVVMEVKNNRKLNLPNGSTLFVTGIYTDDPVSIEDGIASLID